MTLRRGPDPRSWYPIGLRAGRPSIRPAGHRSRRQRAGLPLGRLAAGWWLWPGGARSTTMLAPGSDGGCGARGAQPRLRV